MPWSQLLQTNTKRKHASSDFDFVIVEFVFYPQPPDLNQSFSHQKPYWKVFCHLNIFIPQQQAAKEYLVHAVIMQRSLDLILFTFL